MAGKDTLTVIAEQLGLAMSPLDTALISDGTFSAFMRLLGWDTSGYIGAVKNLGSIVRNILDAVENGLDEAQAADVISQIVNLFSAVSQLSSASGLPGTIDVAEFQSDFPGQLVDYLVGRYLLGTKPTLGATLLAAGVIRQTPMPAAGKRPPYIRIDIAWNDVGNVLSDPLGVFRNAYGWGGASFNQQLFLNNMGTLGQSLGLTVFSSPVSDSLRTTLTQGATSVTNLQDFTLRCQLLGNLLNAADLTAGIDLYALPPTAPAAPGFALLPYVTGAATTSISISDQLSLILKAAFDLAGGILVGIRPNQPVLLSTGIFGGLTRFGSGVFHHAQQSGQLGRQADPTGNRRWQPAGICFSWSHSRLPHRLTSGQLLYGSGTYRWFSDHRAGSGLGRVHCQAAAWQPYDRCQYYGWARLALRCVLQRLRRT